MFYLQRKLVRIPVQAVQAMRFRMLSRVLFQIRLTSLSILPISVQPSKRMGIRNTVRINVHPGSWFNVDVPNRYSVSDLPSPFGPFGKNKLNSVCLVCLGFQPS